MQFASLLVIAAGVALGQETVKDRWIKTAGEDYNVVGRVSDKSGKVICLGLVSAGKDLRSLGECFDRSAQFSIAIVSSKDMLSRGEANVRGVGVSSKQGVSELVSLAVLNVSGNRFTPLRAVDITSNFDYHVNFVSYRLNGGGLEKRSFKYVDATLCFNEYNRRVKRIGSGQFHSSIFCVQPTALDSTSPYLGAPLIARPRNATTERFVSGLFKEALPDQQLFYFAKVKGLSEF
ncbi:hypothetical protein DSO57_1010382 [Entomophthora muscae]|uniref:Uncharacterized protein n=1 Tax=Entomophthora muscae TaxID=34485 RepID=A0ACC2URC2_9FUNG|nr:hypothetical protein DSO57_1010382 [Entomophthora muscae]